MSRRLLLLRHGKSDWDATYEHDHDRPLAERGVRDAKRIGRFLADSGRVPDLVVHSTAVRAARTVELAVEAGDWPSDVRASRDLYDSDLATLLEIVNGVDADTKTLLLAGHQPLWSLAASRLTGGGAIRMPTAAVVCIRFEADDWGTVTEGSGELDWLIVPKLLTDR